MSAQQLSNLDAFAFRLFQFLDTEQRGILQGPKIFPLFSSSKLPKNLLAHTWEISTRGAKGLNPAQFCLALKIISLSQNGIPVNQMNQRMMADPNIPLPKLDYPPQLALLLRTPSSHQAAPAGVKPPQRKADPFGFADIMTMSGIGKPSGVVSASPPQLQKPSSGSKDIPQQATTNFSALDARSSLTTGSSTSVPMHVPTSLQQTGANPRLHPQAMAPPNMFLPPMSNTVMPTQVPAQAAVPRSSTVSPRQERHSYTDTDAVRLREIAAAADLREKQARKQANTAREENERIVRENQNLKQQIEIVRNSESDALRRANDVLQKMSPMQVENTQLKKGIEAWKTRSTEQLERNAMLEEELANLRTEIQENSTRLNTLTLENQELRRRFESSEELSSKLREQNGQYSKENMELKSKLDQEKRRIEALEFDIKELESRNTGLKPVEDRKQAPVSMDARDTEALLFDSGFKALAGHKGLPAMETINKPENETETDIAKDVEADFLINMDFTQKKQPEIQPVVDIKPKKVEVKQQNDEGNLFPSDLVKTRAAKDAYNGFGPTEVQKKDMKSLEMVVSKPAEVKDDGDFFSGLADFGAPVTAPEKPGEVGKLLDNDFGGDLDLGANDGGVTSNIVQVQGDVNGEPKSVLEPVARENLNEGSLAFTDGFDEISFEFSAKPTEKPSQVTAGGDFVTPGDNFDAADFDFPDFDDDFGAPTEPSAVMASVDKTEPELIKMEPELIKMEPEPELKPEPQLPAPVVTQADKAQAIAEEPADDDLKMTAEERDSYIPFFDQADANKDGIVDGKEALKFFTKSTVKKKVLAAIWKLADKEDSGHLTRTKFYIMMHIVVKYRQNKHIVLPKKLPYYLEPTFVESLGQDKNSRIEQDSNIVVPAVLPTGQEGKVSVQSNATAVNGDMLDAKSSTTTSPDVAEASTGKKTKKKKKKKKKGKVVSSRQEETSVEIKKKEEAVPKDSITSGDWEADAWDVNFDKGEEKKIDEKFDDFNFDDDGGAFDGGFDDPATGFDPF